MGNDVAINHGTFTDGVVAFTIIRHMGDDTITGSVDRPIGDGERKTFEWKATRVR